MIILYICIRELMSGRLCKRLERLQRGSTIFWKVSLTLCFWLFETTTIELVVKNNAEVDATGRYILSR